MAISRHVKNIRTNILQYVRIAKKDIPIGSNVTQVASVPEPSASLTDDYIQVTTNNWYYKLVGKQIDTSSIDYGEFAISYGAGHESITIKNSSNQLVTFTPEKVNRYVPMLANLYNTALTTDGTVCVWGIDYSTLLTYGIDPYTAFVVLRDLSSGKQLVTDVIFDDSTNKISINIYSTKNISAYKYMAIITGGHYDNDTDE